jgi:glycosyltransferase involved in cell wall biosynthesis
MLVRTDRRRPSRRVLVHGLDYFGPVFADFMTGDGWNFQYYRDKGLRNLAAMTNALRQCDLVYQIGGRVTIGKFLHAARLFGKDRIVMHWVGSDTLEQQEASAAGKSNPWILNAIHHWADSEWIYREVAALGICCDLVPLPSPRVPNRPPPLPREFSVLVYVPSVERNELYGLDMILEVASQLPQIRFELVGLRDGPVSKAPPNMGLHRRIPDLAEFYQRASVVWRPARHDGLSWMVLEALGYGRHVLWTYPFPGCIQAASASEARAQILRLYQMHQHQKLQINEEGVRFIATSEYRPQSFRSKIRSRLEKILES